MNTVAIWLLIDGCSEMFEFDTCPKRLSAQNIRIGTVSLRPKFLGLQFVPKTPALVQKILKDLAKVLEKKLLLNGQERSSLPREVKHLLHTMKTQAVSLLPIIQFHPSLIPWENRAEYFSRMFAYVRDILRRVNKEAFLYIMNNIDDVNWKTKLLTNQHLLRFYNNPPPGTGSQLQGMSLLPINAGAKFHRNVPEHGLEASAVPSQPHGMLFTRTDMGLMLYAIMSMMLCAMAVSLQRLNQFEHLDLQSLFPGRVVSTEKSRVVSTEKKT